MSETRATSFLTLHQIVRSYMSAAGIKSLTDYVRFLNFAIEGYSDLSIFNVDTVDVAYLAVNPDTNTAVLPVDFISMTKLGVNIAGRMWTLTVNNDILIPRPETICQNPIETVTADTDITALGGFWFCGHWRNGNYIDTLYGVSGGFNEAYYRIDKTRGVIYFDGRVRNDEVILEYKSSGVKSGGAAVPREARPALVAYIAWKHIQYDNRYSMADKQMRENAYNIESHKLTLLGCSFNIDEFLDTMYSTYSQSVKR